MKLALIRKTYTPFGGAERHVDRFLDALLERGHEVHLFTARWRASGPPREGFRVVRVPVIRGARWAEAWSFAVAASRLACAGGYDVVHSFDRVRRCDVYRAGDGCHREWLRRRRAAQPGWLRAIPSLNPLHLVYLALERGLFEGGCRAIVANSRRGREDILTHYRADPDRIHVIYNGVDLDRWRVPDAAQRLAARRAAGIGDDERLVLLVGSGFDRKGVATAVRALAALKHPRARLAVVGRGRSHPYARLAASLGVGDRVRFAGPVQDISTWYAAADLLLLPTVYDPFANVCLEALACGVPVVTSAANGAAEVLTEETGVVVEAASDVAGFAAAVDAVLGWGPSRAGACRRVAGRYSLERHLQETLLLYETVRASSRR